MSEADLRLKDIFAADAPPARDPGFVIAVLHRHERQRLREEMVAHAGLAVAGGGLLWAAMPWLMTHLSTAWPVLAPFCGAMAAVVTLAMVIRATGPAASGAE